MATSFTGIVYTFLTLGLTAISYRFFLYWRKAKEIISGFLFLGISIITVVCGFGILSGIFWAESPEKIRLTVIITSFLVALANSFFAYLTVYIKFPKISPWWGFGALFLFGMITSVLTIIVPVNPYLEATGGINWGIPLQIGILRALLYFLGCFPLFIATFERFIKRNIWSEEPALRIRAFLLGMLLLLGTIIPIDDFVVEPALGLHALISEVLILILAGVVILMYFISIRLRPPKYVKKIT